MTEIFDKQIDELSQDAMPLLPAEHADATSAPPAAWRPFSHQDEDEAEAEAELERDTAQENAALETDTDDAKRFASAIFPAQGLVSFRTLFEGGRQGAPSNHIYELGPAFSNTLSSLLEWAELEQRSVFVIPGLVRPHRNGCKDEDVIGMPAIVADIDSGDTLAKLAEIEALIGPATVVVESGGQTELGPKLHIWFKLSEVARGDDIAKVCAVQTAIAKRFGGDSHFGHPAQVIRLASSWHRKKEPKLVKLREVRSTSYQLADVAAKLAVVDKPARANDNYFDFSNEKISRNLDALRDMDVLTEGKSEVSRWDWFNLIAGAEIADVRAGRKTAEEALQYIRGKVLSHFEKPEDWDNGRIEREFAALVRVDERNHGPIVHAPQTMPEGWSIDEWSIDRFCAPAPEREWLVEGLIPRGVAGIFAAAGDAGKSLLSVWLAYLVGCSPPVDTDAVIDVSTPRFFGAPVVGRGAAVVLTAEDDAAEVHRRIERLDSDGLRKRGKQRVHVIPMQNAGGVRTILQHTPSGPAPTPFWLELRAKLAAVKDLALVVLDPLASFAGGDVENDNASAAYLMGMLNELAVETGATVLLTHHVGKNNVKTANLKNLRDMIRGVTGLVNGCRFAMALFEADEDEAVSVLKALGQGDRAKRSQAGLVFFGGLAKSNAPGEKSLRTLVRNAATGLLQDVTDTVRASTPRADEVDEVLYRELLKIREDDPRLTFTPGATKLWNLCGPIVRKHDLPITREGKSKGKLGIVTVFERMRDKGLFMRVPHPVKELHELVLPA